MYIYGYKIGDKEDGLIILKKLLDNKYLDLVDFFDEYHDLKRNNKKEYLELLEEIYNNDYMEFFDEFGCFLEIKYSYNGEIFHIYNNEVYLGVENNLNELDNQRFIDIFFKYFDLKIKPHVYYISII